jgi:ferritin-like protein
MKTIEAPNTLSVLSHLNIIHTLRSEAYEKLSQDTTDLDLKTLFSKLTSEAREYMVQITQELANYGDGVPSEVVRNLPFYEIWNRLSPGDETTKTEMLNVVLEAESAVVDTYKTFLESLTDIPVDTNNILSRQLQQIEHNISIAKTARHGGVIAVTQ